MKLDLIKMFLESDHHFLLKDFVRQDWRENDLDAAILTICLFLMLEL